jgi:hypothetical protein
MDAYARLQARLVVIRSDDGNHPPLGSGFFVDDHGHILTCWHVVDKFTSLEFFTVTDGIGVTRSATLNLELSNPEADLAVLSVENGPNDAVQWSDTDQDSDLEICTLTWPVSKDLQVLYDSLGVSIGGGETSLGRPGLRVLRLHASGVTHGMSGSPVVDRKTGHPIGILSHRREPKEAFAIPFRRVLARFPALIRQHYWVHEYLRAVKAEYEDSRSESPFFSHYFKLDLDPDHIFVVPEDQQLLRNLTKYRKYPITRAVEVFSNLLIVGEPGGGKTTAVRELARLYADSYGKPGGVVLLPLYIPITQVEAVGGIDEIAITLVQAALRRLEPFSREVRSLSRDQIYDLLDQYRFLFLFDGLNEIAVERIPAYCHSLRQFMDVVRKRETRPMSTSDVATTTSRVVITSRVDNILKCGVEITELTKHRFELQKLTSDDQVASFVEMHIPDPKLRQDFLAQINQHYATSQMAQNPLLLTMMVIVSLRAAKQAKDEVHGETEKVEAAAPGSEPDVSQVLDFADSRASHLGGSIEQEIEAEAEVPLDESHESMGEVSAVDRSAVANDSVPASTESTASSITKLPLSRALLLKSVLNGLLGDSLDDTYRSRLEILNKHSMLAGLAYELRAQGLGLGASEETVRELTMRVCAERKLPTLPATHEVQGMLERAVRDRVLRRSAGALRFWPEVFQEYLVGWVISKDIEIAFGDTTVAKSLDVRAAKKRLKRYIDSADWHQCLAIGAGLVNPSAANWLVSKLTRENPVLAAHCIANASQLDNDAVTQFVLAMKGRTRLWLRIPFVGLAITSLFSLLLVRLAADTDITTPYKTIVNILASVLTLVHIDAFLFSLTSAAVLIVVTQAIIALWYRAVDWCEGKIVNDLLPNGLLQPLLRALILTGTEDAEFAISDLRTESQKTRYVGTHLRNLLDRAGIVMRFRKNEVLGLLAILDSDCKVESDSEIEYAIDRLSQMREPAALEPLLKVIKMRAVDLARVAAGAIAIIATILEEPEREKLCQEMGVILKSPVYGFRKRLAVYEALVDLGETNVSKPRLFEQILFYVVRTPAKWRLAGALAMLALILGVLSMWMER